MDQPQLIIEDPYEALKYSVRALGGTKKVAERLWPALDLDAAARRLTDALNRNHQQKLDMEEQFKIAEWAKEVGDHSLARYFGQRCAYDFKPIDPVAKADELARSINEGLATLSKQVALFNQLQSAIAAPKKT